MTQSFQIVDEEVRYPSSDGQPMAENTEQYRWIVLIAENLMALFEPDPDVFVAADLLWYALQWEEQVEDEPIAQAPDVMVIFGRPKGFRMAYRQWNEANVPPQVVFEILSPSNKTRNGLRDLHRKFEFYQRHGVEEYYIYDPLDQVLMGWYRQNGVFVKISTWRPWISPRLQIQFHWQQGQPLQLFDPSGAEFRRLNEVKEQVKQAWLRAEQERLQKEFERQEKEQAQIQAQRERQEKEQAQIQAERERQEKEQAQIQAERERQEKEQLLLQLEALRAELRNRGFEE